MPRKIVRFSYGNLRISRITNFENRSFSSGQGVVQITPNSVWSIPWVPRVQNRKNFWYSLPRKKVIFSYGNLRISRITNFENRSISSGQGVVQIKPNSEWGIPWVRRMQNRKNFWYSLPRKKVRFSYGNLRISRITNFENRSFSSGQGVVQITPNSVWSIPWVPRVQNRKNFWYSLPRKIVRISYGNLRISRITNFENRSFSSGQGVVQITPNSVWSIPWVPRVQNRKNFWYSLPRKKLGFHTEICEFRE